MEDILVIQPIALNVSSVSSGMPAERSGLKQGDEITQVNGKAGQRHRIPALVQDSQGTPADLQVQRGDRTLQVEVRPQQVGVSNGVSRWQIGIGIQGGDLVDRRLPDRRSHRRILGTNLLMGRQIFYVVVELFRGNMSLKQLEGPLGIAKESGEAAREGPAELLSLMAMIGVNLAVLNLLPIPSARRRTHSASFHRRNHPPRLEHSREGALRHRQHGVPVAGLRHRYVQ
jgi:regulator of sigma E protease